MAERIGRLLDQPGLSERDEESSWLSGEPLQAGSLDEMIECRGGWCDLAQRRCRAGIGRSSAHRARAGRVALDDWGADDEGRRRRHRTRSGWIGQPIQNRWWPAAHRREAGRLQAAARGGWQGRLEVPLATLPSAMTTPAQIERLGEHPRKLQLLKSGERLEALLQHAAAQELPCAEFLEQVLGEEVAAKTSKKLAMRTAMARFPFAKPLETFDLAYQPSIDRKQVLALASCHLIEHGDNVIVLGPRP